MPKNYRPAFIATILLAATMALGAPKIASAQSAPNVTTFMLIEIAQVISTIPVATTSSLVGKVIDHSRVFIAVCAPQSPQCAEFMQGFTLNAALLKGGWTAGVDNMYSSDFYRLDATTANNQALLKACSTAKTSSAACDSLQKAVIRAAKLAQPQLIMINRTTGVVQVIRGFSTQPNQSKAIVDFVRK